MKNARYTLLLQTFTRRNANFADEEASPLLHLGQTYISQSFWNDLIRSMSVAL